MIPIIDIKNLRYHIGEKTIFENISFTIHLNNTIGVIGKNGVGKTTLLKLIKKEIEPDSGEIIHNKNYKLAFLPQIEDWDENEVAIDYIIKSSGQDAWICYKYCYKMGIPTELLTSPIKELSNSFKMRVKLASLFAQQPDFLFLDEPTNYLDLDSQLFLEYILLDFKTHYNKGYFIISRDREFLLRTCSSTLEITPKSFLHYYGNINEFFEWKKQTNSMIKTKKDLEKQKEKLKNFINKFKSKITKSSQEKSKEKFLKRIQDVPLSDDLLFREKFINFNFFNITSPKEIVFECKMSTGYYPRIVSKVELYLSGCEKYAIIGPNGEGKSTFLKTIAGKIKPIEGYYKWQNHKTIGYFSNEMIYQLDIDTTVMDLLIKFATKNTSLNEIKKIDGILLLNESDYHKKLKSLSSGERVRLFLTILLLQKFDILILDEPNTHLDFETSEKLALALKRYKGTILFVSHDRTFVQNIATKIIEVENGKISLYPGTYEDYVYYKRLSIQKEVSKSLLDVTTQSLIRTSSKQIKKNGTSPLPKGNPEDPLSNKKALVNYFDKNYRERKKEIRKLRKELQEMEKVLHELEQKRDELWNFIEKYGLHTPENYEKMHRINERLEELEHKWYELQSKLDELENY